MKNPRPLLWGGLLLILVTLVVACAPHSASLYSPGYVRPSLVFATR